MLVYLVSGLVFAGEVVVGMRIVAEVDKRVGYGLRRRIQYSTAAAASDRFVKSRSVLPVSHPLSLLAHRTAQPCPCTRAWRKAEVVSQRRISAREGTGTSARASTCHRQGSIQCRTCE
jgi:hypothetical protein